MKKNKYLFLFLIVFSSLARAQQMLPQQDPFRVKAGGYLAADYHKSEEFGPYPDGTFENPLLGLLMSGQLAPQVSFMTEASYYDGDRFDLNQAWLGFQASQYFFYVFKRFNRDIIY